jgi:hypothetical protein
MNLKTLLLGFATGVSIGIAILALSGLTGFRLSDLRAEAALAAPAVTMTAEEQTTFQNARQLLREGDHKRGLRLIGPLALGGHAAAQTVVGGMYWEGKGLPQDKAEAVRWFTLAANQDDRVAQEQLGWAYGTGEGVAMDAAEARRWFLKAANAGNSTAQFMSGDMLLMGVGGSADVAEGVRWLEQAAKNGSSLARAKLQEIAPKLMFNQLAGAIAESHGGKISIRELMYISSMVSRAYGGEPTQFADNERIERDISGYRDLQRQSLLQSYSDTPAVPLPSTNSGRLRDSLQSTDSAGSRHYPPPSLNTESLVPNPVVLNPSGPRTYTDSAGGVYTQAGPHAVVNTQTGELIPTNH